MTCVYTGALVRVENYGLQAAADVFEVGDVLIIRFNGNPEENPIAHTDERPPTHIIETFHREDTYWCRLDLGTLVVSQDLVRIGEGHRDHVKVLDHPVRDYQQKVIDDLRDEQVREAYGNVTQGG